MAAADSTTAVRLQLTFGALLFAATLLFIAWYSPLMSAMVLLSYFAHEAGHALTARLLGSPVKVIGCNVIGPFVRRTAFGDGRDAVTALAGPAANLALAGACWLVVLPMRDATAAVWCAAINLGMALLNLLPLPGMDGWRVFARP